MITSTSGMGVWPIIWAMFMDLLRAMRPNQWIKNVFVLAPLVFAQKLTDATALGSEVAAFAIFCALSSSVYLLNDIRDRENPILEVLRHPVVVVEPQMRPVFLGRRPKRYDYDRVGSQERFGLYPRKVREICSRESSFLRPSHGRKGKQEQDSQRRSARLARGRQRAPARGGEGGARGAPRERRQRASGVLFR